MFARNPCMKLCKKEFCIKLFSLSLNVHLHFLSFEALTASLPFDAHARRSIATQFHSGAEYFNVR